MNHTTSLIYDPLFGLPEEIHSNILESLDEPDLTNVLRSRPNRADDYVGWKLTYYRNDQIIAFLSYSKEPPTVDADVRNDAFQRLKRNLLVLLRHVEGGGKLLKLDYVTAQLSKIRREIPDTEELTGENDERLNSAVIDIVKTVQDVKLFCDTVRRHDNQGGLSRHAIDPPDLSTYLSHLLYWMAMDYIRADTNNLCDRYAILSAWEDYRTYLGNAFAISSDARAAALTLLNETVAGGHGGLIIQKYIESLGGCDNGHNTNIKRFPLVYDAFIKGQSFDRVGVSTIATYCLSRGPSDALKLFKGDKKVISSLKRELVPRRRGFIRAWESVRRDFPSRPAGPDQTRRRLEAEDEYGNDSFSSESEFQCVSSIPLLSYLFFFLFSNRALP